MMGRPVCRRPIGVNGTRDRPANRIIYVSIAIRNVIGDETSGPSPLDESEWLQVRYKNIQTFFFFFNLDFECT